MLLSEINDETYDLFGKEIVKEQLLSGENAKEITNLIKALVNYGGYLQKFNGEPEEKLINNLINMPLDNEVVTIGDEYKAVIANNGTTVRAKSANISISSLISLNVKFTLAEGASVSDYRFTVNGQTGKVVGDLPTDKKTSAVYLLRNAGITAAAVFLLMIVKYLLGW